jgi:hypothetical protein
MMKTISAPATSSFLWLEVTPSVASVIGLSALTTFFVSGHLSDRRHAWPTGCGQKIWVASYKLANNVALLAISSLPTLGTLV